MGNIYCLGGGETLRIWRKIMNSKSATAIAATNTAAGKSQDPYPCQPAASQNLLPLPLLNLRKLFLGVVLRLLESGLPLDVAIQESVPARVEPVQAGVGE